MRFLEASEFRRVGGTRDITVSVRVIAATNRDLAKRSGRGRFREDLYYRLNVIPIRIPPLRDRKEDMKPFVERFVAHFNREFRKRIQGFVPAAVEMMANYHWPGNVRQLRNAIERAVLLTDHEWLTIDDLPSEIREPRASAPPGAKALPGDAYRLRPRVWVSTSSSASSSAGRSSARAATARAPPDCWE